MGIIGFHHITELEFIPVTSPRSIEQLVTEHTQRGGLVTLEALAKFILHVEMNYPSETNYMSETDNLSRYKSGVKASYGPKFVCMYLIHCQHSVRLADR